MGLSKDFDDVDKIILLKKLECYGLRGNRRLLTSSYLEEKKQFVSYGRYESTCEKIEVWVTRGSM